MKDTWNGKNNLNFWVGMQAQLNRVEKLLLDYKAREAHKHLDTGRRNSDHLKKEIDEQNELLNRQYAQLTRKQQAMSAQTTDKQQALTTDKQRTPTTGEQPAQPIAPLRQDINQTLARIKSAQIARTITPPRLIAIERERYQLADDISLQETRLVPIVRTVPMTPLPPLASARPKPPQIIEVGPDRIEHHLLPGTIEPLKERMLALALYFPCLYDKTPEQFEFPSYVYQHILPFLRTEERYEFGYPILDYPLDDPRQKIIRYVENPALPYDTIACAMSSRTTSKLPEK
jgi:hypothetical protein